MADTTTTVKPGYQTTEFWLTVLTYLLTGLVMSNVFPVDSIWIKVATFGLNALATFGYTMSRGAAKSA
jgi:hypothetical protein